MPVGTPTDRHAWGDRKVALRRGVGLGWVKASPGRLPTVRAAFSAGPDWAAVPGCPVTRPTGLLTAPRPRGGARGWEMPPCLCVCALVCLGGGGGALRRGGGGGGFKPQDGGGGSGKGLPSTRATFVCFYPLLTHVRSKGAYRALCEKLAVLQHREFGKFRRLKGRH